MMQSLTAFTACLVFLSCNVFVQNADAVDFYQLGHTLDRHILPVKTKVDENGEKMDFIMRLVASFIGVDGKCALHIAASDGNVKDLEMIINSGVNVNTADQGLQRTPLHYAAANGNEKCAEILIRNGAEVNIRDVDNETPIMSALLNGHFAVGDLLAKNGANSTIMNKDGVTLLHSAAAAGNEQIINAIISYGGVDLNIKDDYMGDTPLMKAIHNGSNATHENIVKALLEHGADVNARGSGFETALHTAMYTGNLNITKILVEKGADVSIQNLMGQTPADILIRMGTFGKVVPHKDEILEVLKNAGAKIDSDTVTGRKD